MVFLLSGLGNGSNSYMTILIVISLAKAMPDLRNSEWSIRLLLLLLQILKEKVVLYFLYSFMTFPL